MTEVTDTATNPSPLRRRARVAKRHARAPLLGVGVLGAALVLGGCLVISETEAEQEEPLGPVALTTTVCVSESGSGTEECTEEGNPGPLPHRGNSDSGPSDCEIFDDDTCRSQFMIGYRVADSATLVGAPVVEGQALAFAESPDYAAELTRLAPPPTGQKWLGFITPPRDFRFPDDAVDRFEFTVSTRLALGTGTGQPPLAGPFRWRAVVGARDARLTDPGRLVDCDEPNTTICIDSPSDDAGGIASNLTTPTTDLGVLGGASASGPAGTTIPITFRAVQNASGQPSGIVYTLSATTDVPGGSASPSSSTLGIQGDSTESVPVSVQVPAGTAPGTYQVRLTAATGGNQRTATGTLTVQPGSSPPASNQFSFGKLRKNKRKGIATLRVRIPGPGRLVLRKNRKVKRAAKTRDEGGNVRLKVRPRGAARRKLSRKRLRRSGRKRARVRARARVTYRPTGGEPRTKTRRVRLVRKGR